MVCRILLFLWPCGPPVSGFHISTCMSRCTYLYLYLFLHIYIHMYISASLPISMCLFTWSYGPLVEAPLLGHFSGSRSPAWRHWLICTSRSCEYRTLLSGIHTYTYVCIYTYTYREGEGERERERQRARDSEQERKKDRKTSLQSYTSIDFDVCLRSTLLYREYGIGNYLGPDSTEGLAELTTGLMREVPSLRVHA